MGEGKKDSQESEKADGPGGWVELQLMQGYEAADTRLRSRPSPLFSFRQPCHNIPTTAQSQTWLDYTVHSAALNRYRPCSYPAASHGYDHLPSKRVSCHIDSTHHFTFHTQYKRHTCFLRASVIRSPKKQLCFSVATTCLTHCQSSTTTQPGCFA